jgi:hypothetical protein
VAAFARLAGDRIIPQFSITVWALAATGERGQGEAIIAAVNALIGRHR